MMPDRSFAALPRTGHFSRFNWSILLFTSLGVAAYFPLQYAGGSLQTLAKQNVGLAAAYAGQPLAVQLAFYVHIIAAGIALLVGPVQFARTLRSRHVRVHRIVGRVYVVSALVGGLAALVMAFFNSLGLLGFFGFGSLAILWMSATAAAYRAIRRQDIASHRAWMIRSFALTYAAPTLRIWLLGLLIAQVALGVPFTEAYRAAYLPMPFLCWLPNIVIAEFMIRRRGLPAFRLSVNTAQMPDPLTRAPV